jgi:hypothetical protein
MTSYVTKRKEKTVMLILYCLAEERSNKVLIKKDSAIFLLFLEQVKRFHHSIGWPSKKEGYDSGISNDHKKYLKHRRKPPSIIL